MICALIIARDLRLSRGFLKNSTKSEKKFWSLCLCLRARIAARLEVGELRAPLADLDVVGHLADLLLQALNPLPDFLDLQQLRFLLFRHSAAYYTKKRNDSRSGERRGRRTRNGRRYRVMLSDAPEVAAPAVGSVQSTGRPRRWRASHQMPAV